MGQYKEFNAVRLLGAVDTILLTSIPDLRLHDRLPSDENLTNQDIFITQGSVLCIAYRINIDDIETHMKVQRLIALEFYDILLSHKGIRDIQTIGNKFVALYDTPLKDDIDSLLIVASEINSITKYINRKIGKNVLNTTIAMDYIDIFFCSMREFGISKICYGGDAVEQIISFAENGLKNKEYVVHITDKIYKNIKNNYQDFFNKSTVDEKWFVGNNIYNTTIENLVNNSLIQ